MNAIEDSGDIDLDALLEDLCIMEKDLQIDVKVSEQAEARSPSPSKLANRRLSSPVKVGKFVKYKSVDYDFEENLVAPDCYLC